MFDAIATAMGKPSSPLKAVFIGTLAPSTSGWWHDLIADGSNGSTYVQALQGETERWDTWPEIRRCNPLTAISADFRRVLRGERDAARRDSRLRARFLSYRLNVPSADESSMLLSVEDFERMANRPVPERDGRPIVALDLGGGRAWSAAVAVWRSGRVEALALAPGIPDLDKQEKRDRVPGGTYSHLLELGQLHVADGLHVQPPSMLWELIQERWGTPVNILCDRFRQSELIDAVNGAVTLEPRISRWSEAAFDIRSLRRLAVDGPLAPASDCRSLLAASLSVAMVKNDDQGNTRLVKGTNNTARDDVAAALLLAAGAYARAEMVPEKHVSHVVV